MPRLVLSLLVLFALCQTSSGVIQNVVQLPGLTNSSHSDSSVVVLPNGNIVVVEPGFQPSVSLSNMGAVWLYSPKGELISTLVGSQQGDRVGSGGVTVLPNGHFVVLSPVWKNGAVTNAGAVTWGGAETGWGVGLMVEVSAANSLVGGQGNDQVGSEGLVALSNGHYVVHSQLWGIDSIAPPIPPSVPSSKGAVTWCDGWGGTVGVVSAANSLVGSDKGDRIGSGGVKALSNGHYVVCSPLWGGDIPSGNGAVTWGNGGGGTVGEISAANSLVGSWAHDNVGSGGVTVLNHGNYVVSSPSWRHDGVSAAGAVTWGDGNGGTLGLVSASNSLVGILVSDSIGSGGVTALVNGNYVVSSPQWDSASAANAGAVTWCQGFGGTVGQVNGINSLVGSVDNDRVGNGGVTALANGHYVVRSLLWDNGSAVNAGAVTWGDGQTGTAGPVSADNSLVGEHSFANIGHGGITALSGGHYVVCSHDLSSSTWLSSNGAVTWCDGWGGTVGAVSAGNSLIGSNHNDRVGSGGIIMLTNGHYLVSSPQWGNGSGGVNAGAVTWMDGGKVTGGVVSPANSLVGGKANEKVGGGGITVLSNGNYVVSSPEWRNGVGVRVGAVTWGYGLGGSVGTVGPANSSVGQQTDDFGGNGVIAALSNGNYVMLNPQWKNKEAEPVGAVTLMSGFKVARGVVSMDNSLVGGKDGDFSNGKVIAHEDGDFSITGVSWSPRTGLNGDTVTLGDGAAGISGSVIHADRVVGYAANSLLKHDYDPERQHLIVLDTNYRRLLIFTKSRLESLALSGHNAPGGLNIAYGSPGGLAVGSDGNALFEATLIGSGANSGKQALFAPGRSGFTEMVLRQGDGLAALGLGLPNDATIAGMGGLMRQNPRGGLFQATVRGSGVKASNNRLLLLENNIGVLPLLRSGTQMPALNMASLNRPLEMVQSHDENLIALTYILNKGRSPKVVKGNDSGLLLLGHSGAVRGTSAAREGRTAFGGGDGLFGQFTGSLAAGLGQTVHFGAMLKPTKGRAVSALFRTTVDGAVVGRTVKVGDVAPGAVPAKFGSFKGLSQMGTDALFTATLKGSPAKWNEGLWRGDGSAVLTQKGEPLNAVNVASSPERARFARLLRFWPAGGSRIILQVQLAGAGVKSGSNQALVLRLENGRNLLLMRTGNVMPGVGTARLKTISAVDVDPQTGKYAVLGTLSGVSASENQALWSGNASLGDAGSALLGSGGTAAVYGMPVLRLRKGQTYRTENTPQSVLRSISLRPAVDKSGAGGRGLAQVVGSDGAIALVLTGDRKLSEVVVLR